jgi:hypothetical protein
MYNLKRFSRRFFGQLVDSGHMKTFTELFFWASTQSGINKSRTTHYFRFMQHQFEV